jgi:hypothetical protein
MCYNFSFSPVLMIVCASTWLGRWTLQALVFMMRDAVLTTCYAILMIAISRLFSVVRRVPDIHRYYPTLIKVATSCHTPQLPHEHVSCHMTRHIRLSKVTTFQGELTMCLSF